MEPISFTLALAGLPGIFLNCVECFRLVQFGREFEGDLAMNMCKLEAAEMRLTRWGRAMGICGPGINISKQPYTEEEIIKAYHWLGEIQRAFDSAKEMSARYQTTAKPERLQLLDTNSGGNGPFPFLHRRMQIVNGARIKPRKRDRVAWALYRKGHFETLLETVTDLINNLVELFPSTTEQQKQLCRDEVRDMDTDSLSVLNKIIGKDDEVFRLILGEELASRPNLYYNIELRDRFKGHFGDNVHGAANSRSGIYSNIIAGGDSVAHFGNNVGLEPKSEFEGL